MEVVSACALPIASRLWQAPRSSWVLTVICRATFLLRPGESVLAPDQEPLAEGDEPWDDDPTRSLRRASDLAPLKARVDVTLVGHAFAPEGAKAPSLLARLIAGDLDKTIEVYGDQSFDPSGALGEVHPFSRMPLRHERAAGGPGTSNPVGLPGSPDAGGRIALPNLRSRGLAPGRPGDPIVPVGFGPIAPSWPARREKLPKGCPPSAMEKLLPRLPADLDPSYFNHAPRDQQLSTLREDTPIVLENLDEHQARLATTLPLLRPRATVERRSGAQAVSLRCDTLWIDTDGARCALTWRGQVPLGSPEEQGRIVFSMDAPAPAKAEALVAVPVQIQKPSGLAPPAPPILPDRPIPEPPPRAPLPAPDLVDHGGPMRGPDTRPPAPSEASALPFLLPPSPLPFVLPPIAPPPVALPPIAPPRVPPPRVVAPAPPRAHAEVRRVTDVSWFDPHAPARIRRDPALWPVLSAPRDRRLDPDLGEDQRCILDLLTHGEVAADETAIQDAMDRARGHDDRFEAPLVLVEGHLYLPFDEISALRATVSIASRFARDDEPLQIAIARARETLSAPDEVCPPSMLEGLTTGVEDAFRRSGQTAVPAGYLEAQVARALLERRCYQRREVFGASHLRARIRWDGAAEPWVSYIPEVAARWLPMFLSFQARILGEVWPREEQFEAQPIAIRAAAVARIAPVTPRAWRSAGERAR